MSLKTLHCGLRKQLLKMKPVLQMKTRSSVMGYLIDRKEEEDDVLVNKYIGKHRKRKIRVYGAGFPLTGALGFDKLLDEKGEKVVEENVVKPYRLYQASAQITKLSCGHGFTLLGTSARNGQKLWGIGINTSSQIGYHPRVKEIVEKIDKKRRRRGQPDTEVKKQILPGFEDYIYYPSEILLPLKQRNGTKVINVACGRAHSLVVTDKEGVFSMGDNAHGQTGRPIIDGEICRGSKLIYNIPKTHFHKQRVIKVVCGLDHSLFLTESGQVYSCGWGADGQTGLGHYDKCEHPTRVKGDIENEEIIAISSFADVSLALNANGDVFGWGNSEYNQLSSITKETQVHTPTKLPFNIKATAIAAGGCVCAILDDNGDVWVWGYGILGKGPKLDSTCTPEKIPPILFGRNEFRKDLKVIKIACGQSHFCVVTDIGEVFSWGKNNHGCLGIGSEEDRYFPWKVPVYGEAFDVHCGVDHTFFRSKTFI